MKTKAGKDRKRLPLACIDCRRKKIRCSGAKPACKHCVKSRIPCVYKVTPRRATPRTDYMAMLDKRLKRMEERVIKMIPENIFDQDSTYPRAVLKPGAATSQPKATIPRKRSTDSALRPDLDRWADRTSNRQEDPTSAQLVTPRSNQNELDQFYTDGKELLPPAEIQEHLTEIYFDYVYGQSYYLLHKPSHMQKLKKGTVPPILTLAICAVSARFSTHPKIIKDSPPFMRGMQWANYAQDLLLLNSFDKPNLTAITVCLILGLHEFGTCRGTRSWMHAGMAMRMASALRLHQKQVDELESAGDIEKAAKLSFVDREIRRRCMWGAFMMDRFNSSGIERPMIIKIEDLDCQLPIKEQYFQMDISGTTEQVEDYVRKPQDEMSNSNSTRSKRTNMDIAAYNVRMVALWGQVVQHMNHGGRLSDDFPMWSNRSRWHALSEQIRDFKAALPDELRLSRENLETHAARRTANQFLFLHIAYGQTNLFLHRYAFPAIAMYTPCKGEPVEFVNNGKKAAIEAACAVSTLMQDATAHKVVVPFAGYAAYMSAAIHIYGVFSRDEEYQMKSKEHLSNNIKFLDRMKQWWGTFHYLLDNLRELYRIHADAASRGVNGPEPEKELRAVYQYADWHEKFPRGVSHSSYDEPLQITQSTKDPALGQPTDLQSVEEFFKTSSTPVVPQPKGKLRKKDTQKMGSKVNASPGLHNRVGKVPSLNRSNPPVPGSLDHMEGVTPSFGIPESYDRSVVQPQASVNNPQVSQVGLRTTPIMQPPNVNPQTSVSGNMSVDPQLMPPVRSYNGINYDTNNPFLGPAWNNPGGEFLPNEVASTTVWFPPFNLDMSTFEVQYPPGVPGQNSVGFQNMWSMGGSEQFQSNGGNAPNDDCNT